MLTKLKKRVEPLLATGAKAAYNVGLTPNKISAIGAVSALLSAIAYVSWQSNRFNLILATFLLLMSGFCDALDGVLARLYDKATDFGGFLDSLLDRYADAVVYSGIIVGGLCDLEWGLAALVSSLLVSYSRSRAEAAGITMETVGIAERADRMILLAVAGIIAIFWPPRSVMNAAIILLSILSNVTVLQRLLYAHNKMTRTSGS